jgi:hypothetical protein
LASVDLPLVSEGYDMTISSLIDVTLDHIRYRPKGDTAFRVYDSSPPCQENHRRIRET